MKSEKPRSSSASSPQPAKPASQAGTARKSTRTASTRPPEATSEQRFWARQPASSEGMLCNSRASELDAEERREILALVEPLAGRRVLELGAGIGRYTPRLGAAALEVTAVDFIEEFLAHNRRVVGRRPNVRFLHADVRALELPPGEIDLVFSNWLLMYLGDDEADDLLGRIHRWLAPEGELFLHESCLVDSKGRPPGPGNPARYRDPIFYRRALRRHAFAVLSHGSIGVYLREYGNPHQLYWRCRRETSALFDQDCPSSSI